MATVNADTKLSALGMRPATVRALAENGAAVVADLIDPGSARDVVASWVGIGGSRLADLDAAMGQHGLAYGRPIGDGFARSCATCEICPDCGNPRATSARNVAVELSGRASHLGHRVGPTCDGCDTHHRGLFATAAA